jgi:hypothetical protein
MDLPLNPHTEEIYQRFRTAKNIATCKHCGDTILWAVATKANGKSAWRAVHPLTGERHGECRSKLVRYRYRK